MKELKITKKMKDTYLEELIKCYNNHIKNNDATYLTMKSLRKEIADLRKEMNK